MCVCILWYYHSQISQVNLSNQTMGYHGNCCPYCTDAFKCMSAPPHTHMQSDTFSHKRAALYTSLAWKCQRDFNPLNDTPAGLQWNLRRNQSKTDQCLICRPRAVAALIHRNPPSWKHFCSSIMSWGVFTRYYTTPHYLGWEQHLRKCF